MIKLIFMPFGISYRHDVSSRHGVFPGHSAFYRYCVLLFVLLAGYVTSATASTVLEIPLYTLRYAVTFQGNNLGELEVSIQRRKQNITVRGETFPSALGRMFGEAKVIETVEYQQQGETLKLVRLSEQKGQNNPITRILTVDHINNQLFADGRQIALSIGDQIDAYTFPLLSILGLSDMQAGDQVKLVSAKKVRNYRYLKPVRETINNQAGSFATLKQSRVRLNNSKSIALWVTEQAPLMPVQIQVERNDGQQLLVSLISISESESTAAH